MNLESYRALFLVLTIGLALAIASPAIAEILPQRNPELFSELWLLGPDHKAEGYPFNVSAGEDYGVFVGVGNQMTETEYYMVYVKLCNTTDPSLDVNASIPSSCEPLYEYKSFIGSGKTWETYVTFRFEDVVVAGDVLSVGNFVINDTTFPIGVSTTWNSDGKGFIFELSFELWLYDVVNDSFQFDDRFVSLFLNMTNSN